MNVNAVTNSEADGHKLMLTWSVPARALVR